MVDGANRGPRTLPLLNPILQRPPVDFVKPYMTDPGHKSFKSAHVVTDAALMLVLLNKLRRGLLERMHRPDAVDLSLADLFHRIDAADFSSLGNGDASDLGRMDWERFQW